MTLISGPPCCAGGIRGYGNSKANVFVVGIAPGRKEVERGRPFVGPSGNLFNSVLEASNIKRDDLYITNLCCSWHDEPTKEQLAACKPRLLAELEIVKPKLILGLGTLVSQTLVGRNISQSKGYVLRYAQGQDEYSFTDHFRMFTYHPSAFLHGGPGPAGLNSIYDIVRHIGNVNNILTKPCDGSWGAVRFHSVSSCDEAQRIMDSFTRDELVTVDIETTSSDGEAKDPFTDDILCICFRSSTGVFAIPNSYLEKLVWNTKCKWGFHGGIFDVVGIRKVFSQTLTIAADSLYQSYAIDERAGKDYQVRIHGLGPLSGEYCGTGYYKEQLDRKRLAQYPMPTVLNYCATDTNNTYDLINFQTPKLQEEGTESFYENLLLPAANVFADIAYEGCAIDHKQSRQLQVEWYPRLYKSEVRLQKLAHRAGWPSDMDINTNSPKQLAKLIYDIMGYKQRKPTDRSVDRDHLLDIDDEFVDTLLKQRQLEKMLTTYVEGFQDDVKPDERVHPVPLLHGTSTGRLSYQDPPIQTIPKPYRVGRDLGAFRRMFVPSNSATHCFVEVDYSQLEIWIAQALSGDEQMLADLNSGDYHGRVTTECFGITKDSVDENLWGERRTQAKRVTFQRLYQGGASTLANRITGIGCTYAEAQEYISKFNTRYPSYNRWCADMVDQVTEFGFIQTCFGRKRRFPVINDHSQIRQALNFPIQSIASDVCLTSLIELHWLLKEWDSRVIWTVHDAILFEVSRKHFDKVIELIRSVMTKPRHPSLPRLQVEITAGNNYYDQYKEKEWGTEFVI